MIGAPLNSFINERFKAFSEKKIKKLLSNFKIYSLKNKI